MTARGCVRLALLAVVVAAAPACTDGGTPSPATPAPPVGSVQIGLVVPPSFEIDTVSYQISRGTFSRAGALDVSKSNTITGVVGGLPTGGAYQLTLSATDVGHKFSSCVGSGTFDVNANAVTEVPVDVTCHLAPTTPPPPPSVPVPFPAVLMLGGALLGAGLLRSGSRRG